MGWMFNCERGGLKELLAERCKGWEYENGHGGKTTVKLLARCFKGMPTHGGNLWKVYEVTATDAKGEVVKTERFIALDLIKCNGGCWGYKDIDESMGPCEVNCPLSYLDLAGGEPEGYAKAWRQRVREYHGEKIRPEVGRWYALKRNTMGIEKMQITSLKPLVGVASKHGERIRLKSNILKEALTTETQKMPDLSRFTGCNTPCLHKTGALFTDGVHYLASELGAYWLVDEILYAQRKSKRLQQRGPDLQIWKLEVHDDQTADLVCLMPDLNTKMFTKRFNFTDFPREGIELYFENNTLCFPIER